MQYIDEKAFAQCISLDSVVIGKNTLVLASESFSNCTSLRSVTCMSITPPYMNEIEGKGAFYGVDCSFIPLYVPIGSVSSYNEFEQWRDFNPIIGLCNIRFVNWDGAELLKFENLVEGTMPVYTAELPTRPDDEQYSYAFSGWTPEVVAAVCDATYTATFDSVVNVYTISVTALNGEVEGAGEYAYGTEVELYAIPDDGYEFAQWSDDNTDNPRTIIVTGDAEYTALFAKDLRIFISPIRYRR